MSRDTRAAVECTGLTKRYANGVVALDDLTLTLERGATCGLLGENGAGKSTLVRLLMGFIFPSSGRLSVLGETEVARAHTRIGYVHEHALFELRFTAAAYLGYLGELAGLRGATNRARARAVLEQVHLEDAAERPIHTLSKGMLQRLAIAQALLTDPELLILDEPTSGLDPGGQWEVRQIIAALSRQGRTILLCSHYLTEVEQLCDSVGILRRGHLVRAGAVVDLLRLEDAVEIALDGAEAASEVMARLGLGPQILETQGNLLRLPRAAQASVLAALVAASVPLRSLNPATRTLEDVYVQATRAASGQGAAPPAHLAGKAARGRATESGDAP